MEENEESLTTASKQKNVRKESEKAKIEDWRTTKMGTLIRP